MSLRWPLVALEMGADAHCVRSGTVDRVERRGGPEHEKETVGEVLSQDRVQQRLVKQMVEVRKVCRKTAVEQIFEFPEPQMYSWWMCPGSSSNSQCLLWKLGLLVPERDTTNATAAAVEEPAGEARPFGIAQKSATTASEVDVSSGEAGSAAQREGHDQRRWYSSR